MEVQQTLTNESFLNKTRKDEYTLLLTNNEFNIDKQKEHIILNELDDNNKINLIEISIPFRLNPKSKNILIYHYNKFGEGFYSIYKLYKTKPYIEYIFFKTATSFRILSFILKKYNITLKEIRIYKTYCPQILRVENE